MKKKSNIGCRIFLIILVIILLCAIALGYACKKTELQLIGDEKVSFEMGMEYEEKGCKASLSGISLDKYIVKKGEVINDVPGTYKIEYTLKWNPFVKATRTVTVKPNCDPGKSKGTYIKGILLVNKTHPISKDYNPGVNDVAYKALTQLQKAGQEEGMNLRLCSGFRSYTTQQNLYAMWVSVLGVEEANVTSAKPGQSEHQTGLAFDIGQVADSFADTPDGKWLAKNAHKYGFIIRYQKGKEDITGYKYEPWHVRYVGKTIAKEIYKSGKCLEEYLGEV